MLPTIELADYLPSEDLRAERIARAEQRVLRAFCRMSTPRAQAHRGDTIRVGTQPSFERCKDDREYQSLNDPFEQLVYVLDAYDGYRARRRRQQTETTWNSTLIESPPLVYAPQTHQYRRSWLFGALDIPQLLLTRMPAQEVTIHVEAVRYQLILQAASDLRDTGELWYFIDQELWQVPVHVMDEYRCGGRRRPANRVKVDERTVHGRLNRDRGTGIPLTSI